MNALIVNVKPLNVNVKPLNVNVKPLVLFLRNG